MNVRSLRPTRWRRRRTGRAARASLCALFALLPAVACSDGPSGPAPNPAPVVGGISPAQAVRGESEATVTVSGSGFVQQSQVQWNGTVRTTEFVSATTLRVRLGAADLAQAGAAEITVFSAAPGGGTSNAAEFMVVNPAPSISSLSPNPMTVSTSDGTLTLVGTGFVPESQVRVNGAGRQTTYVSPTELRAVLPSFDRSATGSREITVSNPAPGGGASGAATLPVVNPLPAIQQVSPAAVPTGAITTVLVTGTGFTFYSRAFAGADSLATIYVSPTQLSVTFSDSAVASNGTLSLQVRNSAPGGGNSNVLSVEVRAPVPQITAAFGLLTQGWGDFNLDVNGSGFTANTVVYFNSSPRATQRISSTHLKATLLRSDLENVGDFPVWVTTSGPGGGTSNHYLVTVRAPWPILESLGATRTVAGQASYTLRVNGYQFSSNSEVLLDGVARPTTYVSMFALDVTLTASDLQEPRTFVVSVRTPPPGGGTSSTTLPFQVVGPGS